MPKSAQQDTPVPAPAQTTAQTATPQAQKGKRFGRKKRKSAPEADDQQTTEPAPSPRSAPSTPPVSQAPARKTDSAPRFDADELSDEELDIALQGAKQWFRYIWAKLWRRGYNPRLSELSDEQRDQILTTRRIVAEAQEIANLKQEIAGLEKRLGKLLARRFKFILTVGNIKSGTKSSIAITVMSIITRISHKFGLLIPATQNTATSTLAMFAGIDPNDSINVSEYSANIDSFTEYDDLSSRVPRVEDSGLGVISEDESNETSATGAYTVKQFDKVALTSAPKVDYMGFDQGNDNVERGSIALRAAQLAHVIILPYNAESPVSRTMLQKTIGGYLLNLSPGESGMNPTVQQYESRTGLSVSLLDKLQRAIVVASLGDDDTSFTDVAVPRFDKKLTNPPAFTWEGVGLSMPKDPHLAALADEDQDGNVISFSYDNLSYAAKIAGLKLAIAVVETAALLRGFDFGEQYEPLFVCKPEDASQQTPTDPAAFLSEDPHVDFTKHQVPEPTSARTDVTETAVPNPEAFPANGGRTTDPLDAILSGNGNSNGATSAPTLQAETPSSYTAPADDIAAEVAALEKELGLGSVPAHTTNGHVST